MADAQILQNQKRRHHKLPQSYLKGFAAPVSYIHQKVPDIWVYRKNCDLSQGRNPELISVKETGYEKDFYAFEKETGEIDYQQYEDMLMREFENPAMRVLTKIRNLQDITDKEKQIFARYTGSMITRGDWWRGVGGNALAAAVQDVSQRYLNMIPNEAAKGWLSKIIDERSAALGRGEIFNQGVIRKANDVAEILEQMVWRFVVVPKGMFFVTSDKPIIYWRLQDPDSELIFPISSQVMLSISRQRSLQPGVKLKRRGTSQFWDADSKIVEHVREIICSGAFNEIYHAANVGWLAHFIQRRSGTALDNKLASGVRRLA